MEGLKIERVNDKERVDALIENRGNILHDFKDYISPSGHSYTELIFQPAIMTPEEQREMILACREYVESDEIRQFEPVAKMIVERVFLQATQDGEEDE